MSQAAGANAIDYKLYSGHLGNDPDALPMPVGLEVSGVVAAVVPETAGFTGPLNTGDEVIAAGVRGGYAEQLVADAANVGHKPANLSFEQAAGLLVAGSTAWHLLTATTVGAGETVLLHGGAGGVGLLAVQLAVARGAKVIATASPGRHDLLRGYGAVPVEYGAGLVDRVRAIGAVDVALDLVGTDEALDTSVELVADRGANRDYRWLCPRRRTGHLGVERGRRRRRNPGCGMAAARQAGRRPEARGHRRQGVHARGGAGSAPVSADRARPRKSRTGPRRNQMPAGRAQPTWGLTL